MLQARLAALQRKSDQVTDEAALWLRAKSLQRQDHETRARAAAAAEDREKDRLVAELKIARVRVEEARAVRGAERAEANKAMLELRAKLDARKRDSALEKQRRELLRRHFIDWKLGEAKVWFQHATLGEGRRHALLAALKRRRPDVKSIPPAPEAWPNGDRDGYIDLTPGCVTIRPKRDKLDFASESLGRRLYGDRHPMEAMSGKSPLERCKAMLNACLPHFTTEFPGFMQVAHTLRLPHHGNLDLALFEVLWRFSHAAPQAWPRALLTWPLAPAEMNEFLRALGRGDLELPPPALEVAAASSSSSGAKPPIVPPPAPAVACVGAEVFAVPAHATTAASAAAAAAFAASLAKGSAAITPPPPPPRDPVFPPPPSRPKAGPTTEVP